MMDLIARLRVASRRVPSRASRPALEGLEDRMLLYATTGDHFVYGSRITLSIVPDGTDEVGYPSNLIATLNSRLGPNGWQAAFQDASAKWEKYANINLVWVPDDGSPSHSGNYQQGDPAKGDIRIGGFAQPTGELAFTLLPPPANGASDSGDIFFNTSQPFAVGRNYDLETVAFHEIGHALGLGHSADSNAAMSSVYSGPRPGPTGDDIAGIQAIWGPRVEDGLAQGWANFTPDRAANITPFLYSSNNQILLSNQNIAKSGEGYWFRVDTPGNASNILSATVQSTNFSELSPRVEIYDGNLNGLVGTSAPTNAYGSSVTASIGNAIPYGVYYVHVLGTSTGSNGTGAYVMVVNMGNGPNVQAYPPNTQVAVQPDQGGGGSGQSSGGIGTASNPIPDSPTLIQFGRYQAEGDLLMTRPGAADPKVYRVAAVGTRHPVAHLARSRHASHAAPAPAARHAVARHPLAETTPRGPVAPGRTSAARHRA